MFDDFRKHAGWLPNLMLICNSAPMPECAAGVSDTMIQPWKSSRTLCALGPKAEKLKASKSFPLCSQHETFRSRPTAMSVGCVLKDYFDGSKRPASPASCDCAGAAIAISHRSAVAPAWSQHAGAICRPFNGGARSQPRAADNSIRHTVNTLPSVRCVPFDRALRPRAWLGSWPLPGPG
jgi:hypothetical protein